MANPVEAGRLAARLQWASEAELVRVAEILGTSRRLRLENIAVMSGLPAPHLHAWRAEPRTVIVAVDLDVRVLWACGMRSEQPHLYMEHGAMAGLLPHDVAMLESVMTRNEQQDDHVLGRRRIALPLRDEDGEVVGALILIRYLPS